MATPNGLASPLAQLVEAYKSAKRIGEELGVSDWRTRVQLPSDLNAALRQAQAAVLALPDATLIAPNVNEQELTAIRYFSDHRFLRDDAEWGYWFTGAVNKQNDPWWLPKGDARGADKKLAELHIECVLPSSLRESSTEDEIEDAQAQIALAANYLATLHAFEGQLEDAIRLIADSRCYLFDIQPLVSAVRIYIDLGDRRNASDTLDIVIERWESARMAPGRIRRPHCYDRVHY